MVEDNDNTFGRMSTKNTLLKIVILGDGGVGKSCLMSRFVSNHFDDHNFHTIGVEFMNKTVEVNGKSYTLQVWDTAGQERFKSLRTPFYRGSDICILAYAVDDKTSFINIKMWLNEFLHYAGVKNGIEKFPFIIVGNKSDVSSKDREVTHEQLKRWCEENKISTFIETSAKNDNNVVEAFALAVQRFPSNPIAAARWITQIRLNRKEECWKATKYTTICSEHLDEKEKYTNVNYARMLYQQRWVDLEQKAEKELAMLHHPDSVTLHGASTASTIRTTCCSRFTDS